MKVKTSEMTELQLDWAVARAEGFDAQLYEKKRIALIDKNKNTFLREYSPSTNWAQGGPIIEREKLGVHPVYQGYEVIYWSAVREYGESRRNGPTPLIAAMRCYVASKLGTEVEVPDEIS